MRYFYIIPRLFLSLISSFTLLCLVKHKIETTQNILCSLHRWSFRSDGKFLVSTHFDKHQLETECKHLHLQRAQLQNWNGLLMAPGVMSDVSAQPEHSLSPTALIDELSTVPC